MPVLLIVIYALNVLTEEWIAILLFIFPCVNQVYTWKCRKNQWPKIKLFDYYIRLSSCLAVNFYYILISKELRAFRRIKLNKLLLTRCKTKSKSWFDTGIRHYEKRKNWLPIILQYANLIILTPWLPAIITIQQIENHVLQSSWLNKMSRKY